MDRTRQRPDTISLDEIERLGLVLTGRCNLDCGYCYQDRKKDVRIDRRTLEASIDLALASRKPEVELIFTGGEPLLEREMFAHALTYVERSRPANKRVTFLLLTNGLLLDREVLELLVGHDVRVQLSFDGPPPAQDLRGRDTFSALDDLLTGVRREFPSFFERNLTITSTVTPATLFALGLSVDYFLSRGVHEIKAAPVITHCEGNRKDFEGELERQFDYIVRSSLKRYAETGEVPFYLFRGDSFRRRERPDALTMCGLMRGSTLTVDADGMVYGCGALVESVREVSGGFMKRSFSPLRMGHLLEPGLSERHVDFQRRGIDTAILIDKQDKHSSNRRCADCAFLADCAVCPLSIAYIPANQNPDLLPDFQCAFNYFALSARDRFRHESVEIGQKSGRERVPIWRR